MEGKRWFCVDNRPEFERSHIDGMTGRVQTQPNQAGDRFLHGCLAILPLVQTSTRPSPISHRLVYRFAFSDRSRVQLDVRIAQMVFSILLLFLVLRACVSVNGIDSHFREVQASAQVRAFASTVDRYKADCQEYPPTLNALVTNPGVQCWKGPYLPKPVPLDPWGQQYVYRLHSGSAAPEILSYGRGVKHGSSVAESPLDWCARHAMLATWIAAWIGFFGSIYAMCRPSRPT